MKRTHIDSRTGVIRSTCGKYCMHQTGQKPPRRTIISKAQKIGVTETMLSHERPTKPLFVPVECARKHDIKMQVQRTDGTWECTVILGSITTPGGIKAIECCDLKPGQQLPNGANMMPEVQL